MKLENIKHHIVNKRIGFIFFIVLLVTIYYLLSTPVLAQDATEYKLLAPLPGVSSQEGKPDCVKDEGPCATANSYIPGVIQLIIGIAGVLAVVKIIFGGIQYMSTDAIGGKSEGKTHITNALWGLLLIISAYIILFTINPNLVNLNLEIKGLRVGGALDGDFGSAGGPPDVNESDCVDCVAVSVRHKPAPRGCAPQGEDQVCKVSSTLNSRLISLRNKLQEVGIRHQMWQVTEAFPPTRKHQNSCHYNGTCVDASLITGRSATNIAKFIEAAADSTVGLRAVYEVDSEERAQELRRALGAYASNISVVSGITGEHFSIYLNTPRR